MSKRVVVLGLIFGAAVLLPVFGQKTTEIFIPIGKSPGLSGKYSVIGRIGSFDQETRVLTIDGEAGPHSARITEQTKIWLDRSQVKKTSGPGSPADCREGRLCEVKYVYDGATRTDRAEWIKIRVSGSG